MSRYFIYIFTVFLLFCKIGFGQDYTVDLVVYNGTIYTVDESFTVKSAMAIKGGKIVGIGEDADILSKYTSAQKLNLNGRYVYPGFYDAHCHFLPYGLSLNELDLVGVSSQAEMIKLIDKYAKSNISKWIIGRGWDQNLWKNKSLNIIVELDKRYPETPIYLTRIDGHSVLVNSKALQLAGIDLNTQIQGGEIGKDENGKLNGILVDKAMDRVKAKLPSHSYQEMYLAVKKMEKICLSNGLTSVCDAGISYKEILALDKMSDSLTIRVNAMLLYNDSNLVTALQKGEIFKPKFHFCSVKSYADGSLGSWGALLLKPYTDKPSSNGILIESEEYLLSIAKKVYNYGFQLNTHCIGDSSLRLILGNYSKVLPTYNQLRWRIEHLQMAEDEEFNIIVKYHIVPSVQPAHATSDAAWVYGRIGTRADSAYPYKKLIQRTGLIAMGTDFPVEPINPMLGYYAAIFRQPATNTKQKVFAPENSISRQDALKGMTIWAAYACREENEKGSLVVGKWADFIILETDLIKDSPKKIAQTKPISTYVAGVKVYDRNSKK
ncbi:MAG: amidohydrolase [Bacteroidota bacterium]|nr:amidohydrolase [Bacteroidota bacterium]